MPAVAMPERTRLPTLWVAASFVLSAAACGSDGGQPAPATPDAVPPVIIVQPTDHAVVAGESATFRVAAVGDALRYRWQRSMDSGVTWADIASATTASFTAGAHATLTSSQYRVVVTGGGLAETSSAATLSLASMPVPPAILVDASPATVTEGTDAVFSVTATGTSLAYRWQLRAGEGGAFVDVPGADQATLRLDSVALADNGRQVRVNVSNGVLPSGVFSPAVALTVKPVTVGRPASIDGQPVDVAVVASGQATFHVLATGSPQPRYQWQIRRGSQGAYMNIDGATGVFYTSPPTHLPDNGATFRVIVSNKGARVFSRAAHLSVMPDAAAPTVTAPPRNATVAVPESAVFSVAVAGTPTPRCQWQVSRDGGRSFVNINGATAATYTTPATKATDSGMRYRVVVSNTRALVASAPAILTTTSDAGSPWDERGWAAATPFSEFSPR